MPEVLTDPGALRYPAPPPQPTGFLVVGTDAAVAVFEHLRDAAAGHDPPIRFLYTATEADARDMLAAAVGEHIVALFTSSVSGWYKVTRSLPDWAAQAVYGVLVSPVVTGKADESRAVKVAAQLYVQLVTNYVGSLEQRLLPRDPPDVVLPADMPALLDRLNSGPDLTGVAHIDHRSRLPADWRLSTFRISATAASTPDDRLARLVGPVFDDFERVCAELAATNPEIAALTLQGVEIDPRLASVYTRAGAPFEARRLDTIVDGAGHRWVIENDEMPSGLPVAYHLDTSYGINRANWRAVWRALTADGPLVFLVSDRWCARYVAETRWLVDSLIDQGYPAHLVTTADADRLTVGGDGKVRLGGMRVGTIWRQFPLFEATGHLIALVEAARSSRVRILPEFASWGNKVWFGIFWRHHEFFRERLPPESYEQLAGSLPYSDVLTSPAAYPLSMPTPEGEVVIDGPRELIGLPYAVRRSLVLKAAGTNRHSSRSHGVTIGRSRNRSGWETGVTELLRLNAEQDVPLLLQQMHAAGAAAIPVFNAKRARPELFKVRVLERPWYIAGVAVSSILYSVPATTFRLHGGVDTCEVPRQLQPPSVADWVT